MEMRTPSLADGAARWEVYSKVRPSVRRLRPYM